VDGGADLVEDVWGHVLHVVGGLGVFVGFLEDGKGTRDRPRPLHSESARLKTAAT
jgi:hypothetical protein